MRWVLKTSHLFVANDDGVHAYRSPKQCPPEILERFTTGKPGHEACTIVISNREALEAIRSNAIAAPSQAKRIEPVEQFDESAHESFTLPRWQVLAGGGLAAVAVLTGLLVWAMHS